MILPGSDGQTEGRRQREGSGIKGERETQTQRLTPTDWTTVSSALLPVTAGVANRSMNLLSAHAVIYTGMQTHLST